VTREIDEQELRTDSGAILRAVAAGEDFLVTWNGTVVAELRLLRRKRFAARNDLVRSGAQLPHVDRDRFRRDLDAVAMQDIDD
jgi:antitoxin (DNA-binding transcriptional repressor) of toxin-antitoxin stability system